MKLISLFVFCLYSFAGFPQDNFTYSSSGILTSNVPVRISPSEITRDYQPRLTHHEIPSPGGSSYRSFLMRQKELIRTHSYKRTGETVALGDADRPLVTSSFKGNPFDGSPNDNHLAISNAGKLISVANSNIFIYDTEGDSLLKTISLHAFFDTLQLPAHKYDPRVVYDPKQDKFILVCLNGNTDSTNNVLVAFSSSGNPLDEWNCYALPGNPLNDSSWSDFPAIAITDDELLITVNLLNNDTINTNDSWKFLFKQSIIWQINKQSGYNGHSLQMRLYSDILHNGSPIRNFCPIQGGSTTYGPDIYLLSNRSFDFQNDTFFILRITGLLDGAQTELQLEIRKADVPYGLPPDGKQILNRVLQTNDARVLSGYLEDDLIHFVQNTIHPDTARAAVYHGVIANVNSAKNIYGKIIGDASLDFGYPNISYTGKYQGDDEAIITFNHTSADTFAGFSAVFYNVWQGYSERVTLKAGTAQVYIPRFGNRQRWGDYSGSQLKYNEPGKVWTAGFYGERSGTSYGHSTWISALVSPDTTLQPPASVANIKKHAHKIFPNPVSDIFTMEFELPNDKFLDISIYDASGKLVKTFLRDRVNTGRNSFSFSLDPLVTGVYFLRITDGKKLIADEKIVKQGSGR